MGSLGKPVDMNTSLIHLACLLGIAVAQYGGGYDGGYGGGYDGGYGGGYDGGGPDACMPVRSLMKGKIVVPGEGHITTETDAYACGEMCVSPPFEKIHFPLPCDAWSFNTAATRNNCFHYQIFDTQVLDPAKWEYTGCFNLRQEYEGWESGHKRYY